MGFIIHESWCVIHWQAIYVSLSSIASLRVNWLYFPLLFPWARSQEPFTPHGREKSKEKDWLFKSFEISWETPNHRPMFTCFKRITSCAQFRLAPLHFATSHERVANFNAWYICGIRGFSTYFNLREESCISTFFLLKLKSSLYLLKSVNHFHSLWALSRTKSQNNFPLYWGILSVTQTHSKIQFMLHNSHLIKIELWMNESKAS